MPRSRGQMCCGMPDCFAHRVRSYDSGPNDRSKPLHTCCMQSRYLRAQLRAREELGQTIPTARANAVDCLPVA